ncbi:peptidase U32 family protein [Paraferrimonas sp. SM1919]|uniref:ubiquinone anaerobic biosynthesis protein UbiU n=1 Tax=Paraferrimonas sp. SM1919 TaxID=2662263 RepID=UPI0013D8E083|nr:peptidase U32 family protein [Paraferrimonas sp. SM1919]
MELLCPAGNLASLKAAVHAGADAVYIGMKDQTNARHFAGLNFTPKQLIKARDICRAAGVKLYVAINTFSRPEQEHIWHNSIDVAADANVDAVIMADIGLMDYSHHKHKGLPLHLSVQASATTATALEFYQQQFAIERAVLPRVLSIKEIQSLAKRTTMELEVFAFGSLCINSEGRCYLSSYLTGESPNTSGACSPSKFVRWQQNDGELETRLNGFLLDKNDKHEAAGYPTICKGRYQCGDNKGHTFETPSSLNTLDLLPELLAADISCLKIEGRQRSPAYVTQVASAWRQAIDSVKTDSTNFQVQPQWREALNELAEGQAATLGPYQKTWQ